MYSVFANFKADIDLNDEKSAQNKELLISLEKKFNHHKDNIETLNNQLQ